ncbi:Pleiotropic drug resistance protein 3 [Linum grandiflorum]
MICMYASLNLELDDRHTDMLCAASMPVWMTWLFWVSPVTYGEISLSLNEFLAPRWQNKDTLLLLSKKKKVGESTLENRGLNFPSYLYWVSVGALFGFTLLFNIGYVLALTYLKSPASSSHPIISQEKLSKIQGTDSQDSNSNHPPKTTTTTTTIKSSTMALPFTPLTVVFQDVHYFVDTPKEMRDKGFTSQKLELLSGITGALKPGVLTALMGVSGAGKTTLLDVLSGRKTSGYIEGEIKIGGYPKVQHTFARVSGYCEQTDIHSPHITVEESLMFSAFLRLSPEIDSITKAVSSGAIPEVRVLRVEHYVVSPEMTFAACSAICEASDRDNRV